MPMRKSLTGLSAAFRTEFAASKTARCPRSIAAARNQVHVRKVGSCRVRIQRGSYEPRLSTLVYSAYGSLLLLVHVRCDCLLALPTTLCFPGYPCSWERPVRSYLYLFSPLGA